MATSLALSAHALDNHDHVLGHVTLDMLARAANVTRRTLTNVWSDQAQFRLDLFSHLLDRERGAVKATIAETAHDTDVGSLRPEQAFVALGDRIHSQVMSQLDEITFLAYGPQLDQPAIARRASLDHERHVDDGAVLLRRLLNAVDRRPRAGVSLRQLALVVFTIADGTNRLARTHRALIRDEIHSRGDTHSITGHAVAAVLDWLTEPLDTKARVLQLTALLS